MADNIPALIGYFDASQRYQFTNARYVEWFGPGSSGYLGKTVKDTIPPKSYERAEANVAKALSGEEVVFDNVATTVRGDRFVRVHYVPDIEEGKVLGVFVLTIDTTQEHIDRERIAESEHLFRAVTDNLPALITYIDSNERVKVMNATFEEWVGIDVQAAIGRTLEDVLGSELYQQRVEQLRAALAGKRREFDVMSNLSGRQRHLHYNLPP